MASRIVHPSRHFVGPAQNFEASREAGDHPVTASIGLTFAKGKPSGTAENVIREADAAMYQVKAAGKNRYQVCDTSALPSADMVHSTEGLR